MNPTRHFFLLLAALGAAPLLACSALTSTDLSRLGDGGSATGDMGHTGVDGGAHDGGGVDGGRMCPASCADMVACTRDSCDTSSGTCEHAPDDTLCSGGQHCSVTMGCLTGTCTSNAQCDDGNLCNGAETCSPGASGASTFGCVGGAPPDCNDHLDCTADSCMASGCVHTPNPGMCDDGVSCTMDSCGASGCAHVPMSSLCTGTGACTSGGTCDPTAGCMGGTPVVCAPDSNPCTADPPCNPAAGGCTHPPRDDDGDGHAIARATGPAGTVTCPGGDDCNDLDPNVHPGAPEVCNGIDDNCNGMIDEGGVCSMPPPNDTCATATALRLVGAGATGMLTGSVSGSTSAAMDDYRPMCAAATSGPDVVYSIAVPAPMGAAMAYDVVVTTHSLTGGTTFDTVLGVGPSPCGTFNLCNDDAPGGGGTFSTLTFCSVGGITDYIDVDGYRSTVSGMYQLTVTVTPRAVPCG